MLFTPMEQVTSTQLTGLPPKGRQRSPRARKEPPTFSQVFAGCRLSVFFPVPRAEQTAGWCSLGRETVSILVAWELTTVEESAGRSPNSCFKD